MKPIIALALCLTLAGLSRTAWGSEKSWLVKCGSAASEAMAEVADLKAKGVNILSTAFDETRFRDDVCGRSGVLLAFFLRSSEVIAAKNADASLQNAPQGYPPAGRRTH